MTTIVSQSILFIIRMVGTVILARLLSPNDYGLVGMVTVVFVFAEMFGKMVGLSLATVQKKKISHEQVSTMFWINVLIEHYYSQLMCPGGRTPCWLVLWQTGTDSHHNGSFHFVHY